MDRKTMLTVNGNEEGANSQRSSIFSESTGHNLGSPPKGDPHRANCFLNCFGA